MALKHVTFRTLGSMAKASGLTALAARRYAGAGSIFMLHSIVGGDYPLPLENVQTSAGFLEEMIRYYLSHRIPIVSLSDAMSRIEAGSTQRFVCFTFDDGYRDNLTIALPIFRRYGVPFTIYVTSAFLDRQYEDYWWGQLRHLVMDHPITVGDVLPERLQMTSIEDKRKAYRKLRGWVQDGTLGRAQRDALFEQHRVSTADCLDRDAFTARELAAACRESMLEIGAHAKTHARLSQLGEEAALDDMRLNKVQLEGIIERDVHHFAFPFGDEASCGEREFRLAEAARFKTAVTSRIGNVFPDHLKHRFAIPRLRFLGPCEGVGFMESQRCGVITAISTRFGNPVRLS
jgi:peptidoglycan/xylan/chitin deacetylase (PgdA/CDA1 family)